MFLTLWHIFKFLTYPKCINQNISRTKCCFCSNKNICFLHFKICILEKEQFLVGTTHHIKNEIKLYVWCRYRKLGKIVFLINLYMPTTTIMIHQPVHRRQTSENWKKTSVNKKNCKNIGPKGSSFAVLTISMKFLCFYKCRFE